MKIIKVVHSDTPESFSYLEQIFPLFDRNIRPNDDMVECLLKHLENYIFNNLTSTETFGVISAIIGASIGYRNFDQGFVKYLKQELNKVEILSLKTAENRYPNTKKLSTGSYTLHPCDSLLLTPLENYHKNLALQKDDELIVLLGQMGAKLIRILEGDNQQESGFASVKLSFFGSNGEVNTSASNQLQKNKDLLVKFEGNVVDIEEDLLKNSLWFANDSQLNSIFESRRFSSNKIQEYTLKYTYRDSFDFNFDLAASYLGGNVDLKAEYQALSKKERYFHVEFGKS